MDAPTRPIRTSIQQTACDVCGRTLLRGERAETYLDGGDRHSVCELCTSRALHGGWVREGTEPEYEESTARVDRRRSLLRRRRNRRDADAPEVGEPAPSFAELDGSTIPAPDGVPALDGVSALDGVPTPDGVPAPGGVPAPEVAAEPVEFPFADPPPRSERRGPRRRRLAPAPPRWPAASREPRHVRAVPTSIENKIASAIALFNDSEHPKTVAGIARSLGLPDISVHPSDPVATVVNVVVSWELCWYRYEVELSDEVPIVRIGGQGYELDELSALERQINATADDRGRLDLSV